MKVLVLVAASSLAWAQSTVTTYRADLANGGFTQSSASVSSDHTNALVTQSLNGQDVPLEKQESRVIRSDANGSVTESIVRRYDPTGQLVSTDRTVTETRKSGKDLTSIATMYHSDINGQEQVSERDTTDTHVAGDTSTSNTVVERTGPGWSSLQPVEKRSEITETKTQGKDRQSTTTESIYRGDNASGFREAERKVTSETVTANRTTQDTSDYTPGIDNGTLQFQERRVTLTTTAPGGDQTTVVDVYTPSTLGNVRDPGTSPQVRQQQIVTRVKNPDGSVVDTFSVRMADASATNTLGAAQVVSKTVCSGNCGAAPEAPAAAPPAATAK